MSLRKGLIIVLAALALATIVAVVSLATSQGHLESVTEVLAMMNSKVSLAHEGTATISSSVKEQTLASNEIAGNIESIARMAEENRDAVGRTVAQARQLEELAVKLSDVAGSFKV